MSCAAANIVRMAGCLASLLAAAAATAGLPPERAWNGLADHHPPSRALLARNTIRVEAAGTIPADFHAVVALFAQTNLVDRIQEAYAHSLPEGQAPEFVLQPAASNAWRYTNRGAEKSEVVEVARLQADSNTVAAAYYARGERFFGLFESLTFIQAAPAAPGETAYTVRVHAYPHQALCRFLARHLGLVERFFRDKTREMEDISTRVCGILCGGGNG